MKAAVGLVLRSAAAGLGVSCLSLYGSVDGRFAGAVLQGQARMIWLVNTVLSDYWIAVFVLKRPGGVTSHSGKNVSDCTGVLLSLK